MATKPVSSKTTTARAPVRAPRVASGNRKPPAAPAAAAKQLRSSNSTQRKAASPPPEPAQGGKQGMLVEMLKAEAGATLAQMTKATGWQPHTVRGTISGVLRKKKGLIVTTEKRPGGAVYRIAPPEPTA